MQLSLFCFIRVYYFTLEAQQQIQNIHYFHHDINYVLIKKLKPFKSSSLELSNKNHYCLFLKDFYLFLDRGKREKGGEKHQCVVASHAPPTGDLARNPGMRPD